MTRDEIQAASRRWAEAFAHPMPDGLDALLDLAAEDIRFRDPFNDLTGKAALRAVLMDMVERCDDPAFEIVDVGASDHAGYIRWIFTFRTKGSDGRPGWRLDGMTELHLGANGKVIAHFDHWDSGSQFLIRLPVLGRVIRWVFGKLAVTPPRL